MKSYCVKQKKQVTLCVPGSERVCKSQKWENNDEMYLCRMWNH